MAFSPDGKYIAMGLGTGAVELFDWNKHQRISLFVPDERSVNEGAYCAVSFSADGRWLAASGNALLSREGETGKAAHHLLLWQYPSRELIVLPVTHDQPITWVTFSPDGTLGASVSRDGVAKVWSVPEGGVRWVSEEELVSDKGSLVFWPNRDRHVLALAGTKGLDLWDMDTGQLLHRRETDAVVSEIAFSRDGRRMATSDSTETRLWDVEADKLRVGARITHERNACLAFLPSSDGDTLLAVGADNWMVKLWDVQRVRQISRYVQRGWPQDVAISPDGNWAVSATLPDVVRLWDLRAGDVDECTAQATNWPALAVSPDNRTVAAAAGNGHLLLWDTLTDTTVELPGHERLIDALAFSRDGESIASADSKAVKLWSVFHKKVLRTFDASGARSVALSPDGKWIAAGFTGKITLWDVESGSSQDAETAGRALCLRFSPNSQELISGAQWGTVIWKIRHSTLMRAADCPQWRGNIRAIACSPDGMTLAVPGEESIGFWDWEGRRIGQFPFGSAYPSAVAYSPDGATVVATGPAGVVKFWRTASGEELGSFKIEGVRNVELFPDGHAMVTASMNGTLRVWRLLPPDEKLQ